MWKDIARSVAFIGTSHFVANEDDGCTVASRLQKCMISVAAMMGNGLSIMLHVHHLLAFMKYFFCISRRFLLQKDGNGFNLSNLIKAAEADIDLNEKRLGDGKVHLPTNDITLMHSAVPFLPLPAAAFCAILNFVMPGSGLSCFLLSSPLLFNYSVYNDSNEWTLHKLNIAVQIYGNLSIIQYCLIYYIHCLNSSGKCGDVWGQ